MMDQRKYNDNCETCERTVVELRVYSEKLTPAAMSRILGLSPTVGATKGELLKSGSRQRLGPVNSWILSSELKVDSKDARRHLDWLLDQLLPVADALRALGQNPQITLFVTCIWWSAFGGGGPIFWPEQLQRLGELGLELEIDFAFFGDDSENA